MATKADAAAVAAKRRQQINVLAVGGVLLAGLVMLQAPKVLNHGKKSSSTSASTTSTSTAGSTTDATSTTDSTSTGSSTDGATATPSTPTTTPVTVAGNGPAAKVAGVIVRSAGAPKAGEGQLWSLSRFKVRDPFVQQVADASGTTGSSAGGAKAGAGATAGKAGATKTGGVVVPTTVTPAAIAYVTLMVNGKPQQLTLRDVFPKGQPTFVVRGVGKKFVAIGVAGGGFVGGAVVKLEFGQAVTLMNTATGQRFVMKLVYTGPQPEQIAGFKAPVTTAPATTGSVTTAPATTAPAATSTTAAPKA
jgi:hypothetical protein